MALITILFCVLFTAKISLSAHWTEWQDATLCSAPACNCPGHDRIAGGDICKQGEKLQVRNCVREEGEITPCEYGNGPIRKKDCVASSDKCPGWSAWNSITACDCPPYKNDGRQTYERECTNPSPTYGDLGCWGAVGSFKLREDKTDKCKCDVMQTTPTTTTTTTTEAPKLPCCCELYPDEPDEDDGFSIGRRRRSADYDYCTEGPECCPANYNYY